MFLAFVLACVCLAALFVVQKAARHHANRKAGGHLGPVPFRTKLTGFLTVAFAIVTAVVFIPMGLLLAIILVTKGGGTFILGAGLAGLCAMGFLFVGHATRVPADLAAGDVAAVKRFVRCTTLHHLAVAGFFALLRLFERFPVEGVAVPCLVGLALAVACHRAVAVVDRMPRAVVQRLRAM